MIRRTAIAMLLLGSALPANAQDSIEGKWVSYALTTSTTRPLKGKNKVTLTLMKDNRYTMVYYYYPFMSVTVHYSYTFLKDRHETHATDKYGNNLDKHHRKIRVHGTYTLKNDTILFATPAGMDTARVVHQPGQLQLTETVTVDHKKTTYTIYYKAK